MESQAGKTVSVLSEFTEYLNDIILSLKKKREDIGVKRYNIVIGILFRLHKENFTYCSLIKLQNTINELFAQASSIKGTATRLINLLLLLMINNELRRIVPKIISFWPLIIAKKIELGDKIILKELLDNFGGEGPISWLSALVICNAEITKNSELLNNSVVQRFLRIIKKNENFCEVYFAFKILNKIYEVNTPVSVCNDAEFKEMSNGLLDYISGADIYFNGLFQISKFEYSGNSSSFENEELILMQIVDCNMLIWIQDGIDFNLNIYSLEGHKMDPIKDDHRFSLKVSREYLKWSNNTVQVLYPKPNYLSLKFTLMRDDNVSSLAEYLHSVSENKRSIKLISHTIETADSETINSANLVNEPQKTNKSNKRKFPDFDFSAEGRNLLSKKDPQPNSLNSKTPRVSQKMSQKSDIGNKIHKRLETTSRQYGKKASKRNRDIWELSSSLDSSPQISDKDLKYDVTKETSCVVSDSEPDPSQVKEVVNASSSKSQDASDLQNICQLNCSVDSRKANHIAPDNYNSFEASDEHNIVQNPLLYSSQLNTSHETHARRKGVIVSSTPVANMKEKRSMDFPVLIDYLEGNVNLKPRFQNSASFSHKIDSSLSQKFSENVDAKSTKESASMKPSHKNEIEHTENFTQEYSELSEGLSLFSSNVVRVVKDLEHEIIEKRNELQRNLNNQFNLLIKNHAENLKRFNDYVTKRSDEIFQNFR